MSHHRVGRRLLGVRSGHDNFRHRQGSESNQAITEGAVLRAHLFYAAVDFSHGHIMEPPLAGLSRLEYDAYCNLISPA